MILLELLVGATVIVVVGFVLMVISELISKHASSIAEALLVVVFVGAMLVASWAIGMKVLEAVLK